MKVYGPYYRDDGRQHVIVVSDGGNRRTVSYPKYLIQIKLGRELNADETVDHVDGDLSNNHLDNLRVVSRAENASLSRRPIPRVTLRCPQCHMLCRKRSSVNFVQLYVLSINSSLCERCKSW